MQVSGGLHGVGISVVNALSEQLEVTVWRQGIAYSQSFRQGAPVTELRQEQAAPADKLKRGTELRFLFDSSIFSEGCAPPALHSHESCQLLCMQLSAGRHAQGEV